MNKTIEQVQANLKRLRSRLKRTVNAIDKLEKAERRLLSKPRSGVAQLVEHAAVNRAVAGSSPAAGAIGDVAQLVEQRPLKPKVVGSSPAVPASDLDIPVYLRRDLCLGVNQTGGQPTGTRDKMEAEAIRAEAEERRKLKARGRIAKMKAKKAGELSAMPLSGKAALAKISARPLT
jgi:hypothetical protein